VKNGFGLNITLTQSRLSHCGEVGPPTSGPTGTPPAAHFFFLRQKPSKEAAEAAGLLSLREEVKTRGSERLSPPRLLLAFMLSTINIVQTKRRRSRTSCERKLMMKMRDLCGPPTLASHPRALPDPALSSVSQTPPAALSFMHAMAIRQKSARLSGELGTLSVLRQHQVQSAERAPRFVRNAPRHFAESVLCYVNLDRARAIR
jgi:hypothetical protein